MANETGASALLATLLDPAFDNALKTAFVSQFRRAIEEDGVDSLHGGPSHVVCEQDLLDLLLAWGDWLIVVENKVAAGAITREQLNKYYRRLVRKSQRQEVLGVPAGQARIAVVYLTPTSGVGGTEFASLALDPARRDAKVHLAWPDLLGWLEEQETGDCKDLYASLIACGAERVRTIIASRSTPKTVDDENQRGIVALVDQVRGNINSLVGDARPLKLKVWPSPEARWLYTDLAEGDANVNLRVLAAGSDCTNAEQLDLAVELDFKVADKAPQAVKEWFARADYPAWAALLGLAMKSVEVEGKRMSFTNYRQLQGVQSEVAVTLAASFMRFVCVFEYLLSQSRSVDAQ
ncbi:hypothetical protein KOR34_37420 [Posidoniimonas corsicana]|uniref:PD-(D/E)XK nuclease superfamily protein n=1 Tax=Posidoniimonas corsicana TaxID=1938618 RepID=A0A5C5V5U3_9BACT|nr:PD-(D/E)XK nuclease family protein [Posidoniimonas corsicana]TWT33906.1 hypothetical protein KOR34_37420 [Posidoniimonas corsicana]